MNPEATGIPHRPHRGSDVEAWLKRWRDGYRKGDGKVSEAAWFIVDALLDDYREHADTGTPLDAEVMGS